MIWHITAFVGLLCDRIHTTIQFICLYMDVLKMIIILHSEHASRFEYISLSFVYFDEIYNIRNYVLFPISGNRFET